MTTHLDAVTGQLTAEIGAVVRALGGVLGLDPLEAMERRLPSHIRALAADLCSDDDRLAAEAVLTVMTVLWPRGAPEDTDPGWWQTPVGRMVAGSIGRGSSDAVTYSVAAAMLGVHPGTVAQLASRGTLDRHPDGGLTRASVLARVHRLGERPT